MSVTLRKSCPACGETIIRPDSMKARKEISDWLNDHPVTCADKIAADRLSWKMRPSNH